MKTHNFIILKKSIVYWQMYKLSAKIIYALLHSFYATRLNREYVSQLAFVRLLS